MTRTQGAKNKPKPEVKPTVTKTEVIETKPKETIIKKDVKNFEEKPQEIIKQEVQEATATKPKIIKTTVKKLIKKPEQGFEMDQNKGSITGASIPKKYILIGLFGLGLAIAYWKKDKILEKVLDFKMNRKLKEIEKEIVDIKEITEVK